MTISNPVSIRKKSFDEELNELKQELIKMQENRSRNGRVCDKNVKPGITSQISSESQQSINISPSPSPIMDLNWLRALRERDTPSPCSKENLERIRKQSSVSISKKREIKDALQKRLSELFASTLKESRSGSTIQNEVDHIIHPLDSKADGSRTMISRIPTLSSEDTMSTSHANLMMSESLSADIFHQVSSDSSIQMEQFVETKSMLPQHLRTNSFINNEENQYYDQKSSILEMKSNTDQLISVSMKESTNYRMKSHFSMEEITVSGNFFSFKIH